MKPQSILICLLMALIVFSGQASAGWLQEPGRLFEETVTGKKDHVQGAVNEVILNYNVVITNNTEGAINYRFGYDNQPSLLGKYQTQTWAVKNIKKSMPINFDNGHGQRVTYNLDGGSYNFGHC
jgi:hypothetical protein